METKETDFIFTERSSKNQKFDKRLIAHIVDLAEQGVPRRDLISQYGMSSWTLGDWLSKHGSNLKKRKSYTTAEKRSVVRAIEAGMSIKDALITYNISYSSVIRNWISLFKDEKPELSIPKLMEMPEESSNQSENIDVKALQKALEEANLKIKALDTMIDIAEEQLKIDIRKKSGARQSSK
jgi:transposase-like protein